MVVWSQKGEARLPRRGPGEPGMDPARRGDVELQRTNCWGGGEVHVSRVLSLKGTSSGFKAANRQSETETGAEGEAVHSHKSSMQSSRPSRLRVRRGEVLGPSPCQILVFPSKRVQRRHNRALRLRRSAARRSFGPSHQSTHSSLALFARPLSDFSRQKPPCA